MEDTEERSWKEGMVMSHKCREEVIQNKDRKGHYELGNRMPLVASVGEGNGSPLQYSCLANPMDGAAWKAAVHGVAEGRTQLRDFTFTFHLHALEK